MSQSRAQTSKRDKRWLGRAASLSIIANRLRELGHAPDFFSPGALAELVGRAGGSEQRLRAGLAGALFLAATDDAPCVERVHVERAFPEPAVDPRPSAGRHRVRWLLPCAAGVLAVSLVVFHERPRQEISRVPETKAASVHSASSPKPAAPAISPPILQSPAIVALPHANSAPAPQTAAPRPIQIALPAGPQALVRLLTGSHSDPTSLMARLRQAGIAPIVQPGSAGPLAGDEVLYYFVEDGILAQHIARLAQDAGVEPLPQPRLVQPFGSSPLPPGSIDIVLR